QCHEAWNFLWRPTRPAHERLPVLSGNRDIAAFENLKLGLDRFASLHETTFTSIGSYGMAERDGIVGAGARCYKESGCAVHLREAPCTAKELFTRPQVA